MNMLLFTNSSELFFCSIVVRVWVGDNTFLEVINRILPKSLSESNPLCHKAAVSCYNHKPGLLKGPMFPIFQGVNVDMALIKSES